jgi:hypothetical protein
VDDGGADAGPEQQEHRDERRVRETGHGDDKACDAAGDRQRAPEHEQSEQAADPDRARGQVKPVEEERHTARRGLRRVAGRPGYDEHGEGRRARTRGREQLRDRARRPLRPVDPDRHGRRRDEERKAELEVEVASAEGGGVQERDDRAEVEGRAQRELSRCDVDVDRDRDQPQRGRQEERYRDRAQVRPVDAPDHRPRDAEPQHEEPDRRHDREEGDRARGDQPRSGRGLADRRDHELGLRALVRPDGERERASDRVAVDGDDAPVDEVPALGDLLQRHDERVRIGRRARRAAVRHLVPVLVGDGDDREARLDRLVEGKRDLGGWGVDDAARRRDGADEVGVRRRRGRDRERDHDPGVQRETQNS